MKDLTNTGTSIIVFWWFGDVSVQEKFERGDGCGLLYVLWEVVPGSNSGYAGTLKSDLSKDSCLLYTQKLILCIL